jgi:hypothetical protein
MAWVTAFIGTPLLPFCNYYTIVFYISKYEINLQDQTRQKRKKMKIRKTLKEIAKKDGKHSLTAKTVNKLKNSKEFSYLVDTSRA